MFLAEHEIPDVPESAIYIPNFITESEEREILSKVYAAPKPKWTQLKNRRLQNWGGHPHAKGMIPEPIPEWLHDYICRVEKLGVFEKDKPPNHVLVNEYTSGQGIMPHLDGPLFHPVITTVNCGSHGVLNFYSKSPDENATESVQHTDKIFSFLLERRSLLILRSAMYTSYLHGIDEVTEDTIDENIKNLNYYGKKYEIGERIARDTRISLTIRRVPKCSNFKLRF